MAGPRRVLVVDDSALMRRVLTDLLNSDPDLRVVGAARDGIECLEQVERLKPDVITLDIEMPKMGGLETLDRLLETHPLPVVVVSGARRADMDITMEALMHGAVDFIAKPGGTISPELPRDEILTRVKAAVTARVPQSRWPTPPPAEAEKAPPPQNPPIVVLAASTGGPGALRQVLSQLPYGFPGAILVVQHMPAPFMAPLALRLGRHCVLPVHLARSGDTPQGGRVYVAPGDSHLVLQPNSTLRLTQDPPIHGVRPAADTTLESVARVAPRRAIGVVLTGMGRDGARGLRCLREAGGRTLAQDEATSTIYGMPRAAMEEGGVEREAPLGDIPGLLTRLAREVGQV
ncbi:MAG: chemotaxis response regulator protein-glutamate methylesterase [Euryarchaeota archaeon]|nr:chemotaxis response regulator protein-glutamate methylesterase [Euryarchaeota archaeon]